MVCKGSRKARLCNQPKTVELATRIARPYGSAKDVILEQAQFWRERELPDDPWLAFAWSHFGRDQSRIGAADYRDWKIDSVAVVAHHGQRRVEALGVSAGG